MNDFTKEELETLKKSIEELIFSKFYASETQEVHHKIQDMIENYCEHTPSDKQPNEFKWQLCIKCGKDYK